MKKVLYICLVLILLSGVGIGLWFMRQGNQTSVVEQSAADTSLDLSDKTVFEAYSELESTKHLSQYEALTPALNKTESAIFTLFFAPKKEAVEAFTKDTALGLERFLPYHVVISDTAIEPADGMKLKTDDGQELLVFAKNNDLYLRDAKGNEVRLRKPITAKNGRIYIIDSVLLTQ